MKNNKKEEKSKKKKYKKPVLSKYNKVRRTFAAGAPVIAPS